MCWFHILNKRAYLNDSSPEILGLLHNNLECQLSYCSELQLCLYRPLWVHGARSYKPLLPIGSPDVSLVKGTREAHQSEKRPFFLVSWWILFCGWRCGYSCTHAGYPCGVHRPASVCGRSQFPLLQPLPADIVARRPSCSLVITGDPSSPVPASGLGTALSHHRPVSIPATKHSAVTLSSMKSKTWHPWDFHFGNLPQAAGIFCNFLLLPSLQALANK